MKPTGPKPQPIEQRFWPKVSKTNGCWLWIAQKDKDGYGRICEGGRLGRPIPAHRVSWELHHGQIIDGRCVLHHCDNPSCVRPDHLFLGTKTTNATDRDSKGRQAKGEDNGGAKLSIIDVDEIRAMNWTQRRIAEVFGITQANVSLIKRRLTWAHV